MDRIGGFTVILATLLLVRFEPLALLRPGFGPAGAVNPATAIGERLRGHRAEAARGSRLASLLSLPVFPTLEERSLAAARAPADLRLPINLATPFDAEWPIDSPSGRRRPGPPYQRRADLDTSRSTAPLPAAASGTCRHRQADLSFDAQARAARADRPAAFRSTSPPPCGSPTPGR